MRNIKSNTYPKKTNVGLIWSICWCPMQSISRQKLEDERRRLELQILPSEEKYWRSEPPWSLTNGFCEKGTTHLRTASYFINTFWSFVKIFGRLEMAFLFSFFPLLMPHNRSYPNRETKGTVQIFLSRIFLCFSFVFPELSYYFVIFFLSLKRVLFIVHDCSWLRKWKMTSKAYQNSRYY